MNKVQKIRFIIILIAIVTTIFYIHYVVSKPQEINYIDMIKKIDALDSFTLIVYDNKIDNKTMKNIEKNFNDIFLFNVEENYLQWLTSDEGQEIRSFYANTNFDTYSFWDEFLNKYYDIPLPEIYTEEDMLNHISLPKDGLSPAFKNSIFDKADGKEVFIYMYLTQSNLNDINCIYTIEFGNVRDNVSIMNFMTK